MKNSATPHPDNDRFLRFCHDQSRAVQNVYDACFRNIQKMIKKYHGKEEDAEDVFQQGLLVLLKYCEKDDFVLTTTLCGFIYGVCSKIWFKKLQKRQRLEITFKDFSEYIDLRQVISVQQEEEQQTERFLMLWKHLKRLPDRQKRLLQLFYLEGKSMQEIARIMNFANENSAKVQKFKYLQNLRNQMRNDPDFD